jgi:DNA-binding MarR family transcriptional regulator
MTQQNAASLMRRWAARQALPVFYLASHLPLVRPSCHNRYSRPPRYDLLSSSNRISQYITLKDNLGQDYLCREQTCYTSAMPDATEKRVRTEDFVPRPLTEHMGWLLSRASHRIGVALAERLAPLGLNLRDYTVLIAAERAAIEGAARTQLALAQAARLDKSTMVVALDALEGEGLVERRADPKDRRARIVVCTDAGRELLMRTEEVVLGVEGEFLAEFADDELRALRSLLTRLVVAPRSVSGEPGSCQ